MAEITKPSQEFVEVKEIKNGVVFLKRGGMRRVLMVGGINFDLKSESEQTLILNSFQNFLNTLDFTVQFFIHSRKTNIGGYLERMEERKQNEPNELLKIQIEEYIKFINSFVAENAIISKNFFVVVPYESIVIVNQARGLLGIFNKSKPSLKEKTDEETRLRENLEQLNHRVDQIVNGLGQIGLRAAPLNDEELTELFYNLYNPQLTEKKGLEIVKGQKP